MKLPLYNMKAETLRLIVLYTFNKALLHENMLHTTHRTAMCCLSYPFPEYHEHHSRLPPQASPSPHKNLRTVYKFPCLWLLSYDVVYDAGRRSCVYLLRDSRRVSCQTFVCS